MTRSLPVYAWPPFMSGKGEEAARHLLRNPEGDMVCPCCFLVFESEHAGSIHVLNKHPAPVDSEIDHGDFLDLALQSATPAPRAADTSTAPGDTSAGPTAVERVVGRAIRAALKAGAL